MKDDLVERLRMCAEDPMWAGHAEVPKTLLNRAVAEILDLRTKLAKANSAEWFYYGDDCSSDQCRFDINDCISEDFEWDNTPEGDHVLKISGARATPDMWVALHYFTEAEKDDRGDDEPYAFTVHASEEEARAAIEDQTP